MGGGASRWRRATKKFSFPCASFSSEAHHHHHHQHHLHLHQTKSISSAAVSNAAVEMDETPKEAESSGLAANKSLCAICLEPLGHASCTSAIFTAAECSHSFHSLCITSNVRHGNITCPVCRAHWSRLPRDIGPPCHHLNDPVLRIIDDSIATSRVNRRSSLRSTRYDDDDPVELDTSPARPRLDFALIPNNCSSATTITITTTATPAQHLLNYYLSVKLAQHQALDIVIVASPNRPHLRLLKQSMALVVFSLRSVDRLAIVTFSSSATRAFPLRRMSAHGKRAALQAIDRMFYLCEADPAEGLRKGAKILEDRVHRNPNACILQLSDSPTARSLDGGLENIPVRVHRFHVGFGYGMSAGFVMHEFEEFLSRLLGGLVREVQVRVGEGGGWLRLGELRGGEERRIPVEVAEECRLVRVRFSYVDGGGEERTKIGEVMVEVGEKSEGGGGREDSDGGRRSMERWDYHDPFMARRWAKHLHGCRG